jgi:hypothetical protein
MGCAFMYGFDEYNHNLGIAIAEYQQSRNMFLFAKNFGMLL